MNIRRHQYHVCMLRNYKAVKNTICKPTLLNVMLFVSKGRRYYATML